MPKSKPDKQGAARFEAYYALQHIVPDSEWPTFLKTLATPLPITFRITDATHDGHAAWLEAEAARLGATRLPWYACGAATAWTFAGESRRGLRAARDAARDAALRDFLVSGTTSRNLSRQEAVSMVPALLLGAAPGWAVLDACAAPGNKTAQLLERCGPGGLVVANDLSKKRSYALACHCAARLGVRAARLVVASGDAARLPGPDGRFDGVLCDVPCSGDGTIRKAPRVREAWACDGGDRLHGTQIAIARRCAALLRPGGRMVYSTCSLNPVENEAVVAEVLRLEPTLELAAAASPLPARPGLTTWAPCRDDGGGVARLDDDGGSRFPPKQDAPPLERCLRFLPHDGDTGGFFCAVLEKRAAPVSPPGPPPPPAPPLVDGAYRPMGADAWAAVADFLDLAAAPGHVMVRSEHGEAAWLLSDEARDEASRLQAAGRAVEHAGVKILDRRGGGAAGGMPHRLCGDGVAALLPSLGDARRLRLDAAAYAALLEDGRTAAPDDVGVGSLVATLGDGELPIVLWKGARRSASLMSSAEDVARLRGVLGRRRAEQARCALS